MRDLFLSLHFESIILEVLGLSGGMHSLSALVCNEFEFTQHFLHFQVSNQCADYVVKNCFRRLCCSGLCSAFAELCQLKAADCFSVMSSTSMLV